MEHTQKFTSYENRSHYIKDVMRTVHSALSQKGYDPITQITGYILSDDPTYITSHNNARSLICRIDRDELLQELVRKFLTD